MDAVTPLKLSSFKTDGGRRSLNLVVWFLLDLSSCIERLINNHVLHFLLPSFDLISPPVWPRLSLHAIILILLSLFLVLSRPSISPLFPSLPFNSFPSLPSSSFSTTLFFIFSLLNHFCSLSSLPPHALAPLYFPSSFPSFSLSLSRLTSPVSLLSPPPYLILSLPPFLPPMPPPPPLGITCVPHSGEENSITTFLSLSCEKRHIEEFTRVWGWVWAEGEKEGNEL